MSDLLRRSKRVNAGKTNKLDDYVGWSSAPRKYNKSEPNIVTSKSLQEADAGHSSEINYFLPFGLESGGSRRNVGVSSKTENGDVAGPGLVRSSSKVSDVTRISSKNSERSKVSSNRVDIERKRLALETEVAKAELMMKKQELENKMRILDLQKELAEAKIEEEIYMEQNTSRKSISFESVGDGQLNKNVNIQDWVDKCEVLSVPVQQQNIEVKTPFEQASHDNDNLAKLCTVMAEAVKSVSRANTTQSVIQLIDGNFPTFDGKPEDWPLFISQYKRKLTMHQYSEDEVVLKLQKSLKGEALEAVRSLLLHPKNISHIINTLEMRFGRPEYVIGSLIHKSQNLHTVKDGDFNNFIKFSCHINNLVATLEQFEASNHLENPFLLEQLVTKIPNGLKLQWGQVVAKKGGKVNLKDFGNWTNEVSSAACYVSPKICTTSTTTPYHQRKYNTSRPENVMFTHQTVEENKCPYCNEQGHTIFDCSLMKNDTVDVRWSKLAKTKVCYCCLKNGHSKRFCRSKQRCGFDGCKLRHHVLLHKCLKNNVVSQTEKTSNEIVERVLLSNNNSKVLLRITPVKIYGPKGFVNTYALFDEGSTISLLESEIAEQLGFLGQSKPLCMQWANNIISYKDDSKCIDLNISGVYNEAKVYTMNGVRTVRNLELPSQTVIMENFKNYTYLQGLPIQDLIDVKPMILIGQDNIHLTVARKVYQGNENSPVATKTNLGWVLHGNVIGSNQNPYVFNFHICACNNENELNRLLLESFSTESFGVSVNDRNINASQRRAIEILEKTTKYLENERRYETGLIWKDDNLILPESKTNVFVRLLCIERKMLKDKTYFDQYCQKIQDYLKKGYIRKLESHEIITQNPRIWYLPHFGVVNPNKPNKLRLVFDAAAKSHGTSLNDNLLQGPDYLSLLPGVLMRFRRCRWGFCGDIAEMFHRVKIRPEDRCAQRFIWRNGDPEKEVDVYELQVMMFGASCSPCSAQYVKNLNARQSVFPDLIRDVERNFYVDDYLDSCSTEYEALMKIDRIVELHKRGGFNIVNWLSNSPLIIEKYGNENTEKYFNKSLIDRILGVWWDVKTDAFMFKIVFHKVPKRIVDGIDIPTKRQVLQLVMSVFDPLGFLTCLTIKGRIILQTIWRSGVGWDDTIPTSIHQKWIHWLECLHSISSIQIPRCYSPFLIDASAIELHIFCDGSEEAFASVAYLRIIYESHIDVSLVSAKARVSPLKPISVPRLELQAALMGSRLLNTILTEIDLPIANSYLWSDSKTVLCWIKGDGRNYKQFVAHRIGEIQELTVAATWRYVPTELNVADAATRFTNLSDIGIISNSCWFQGPAFLRDSSNWPPEFDRGNFNLDDENEKKAVEHFVGFVTTSFEHLPEVKRFSKWRRLIRSSAWVLRFCRRLLGKLRGRTIISIGELTVQETEEAKKLCLKRSQEESFCKDMKQLIDKGKVGKNSRLYKLCPFIDDDGYLRMQSRLSHALCLDPSVKTPLILDPKNETVILLLQYYHEKFHHQGKELILNEIRQEYWVIKGRQAVKSTWNKCQYCKVTKSIPSIPKMGDLPTMRLTPGVKPFTHTGVDYFGPLNVTVGRHKEKRWGVLFTCMTIRAIHLEIAHSLTTDGAIMALRRMISRRGHVRHLYSDNASNFRGANEELKILYKDLDHQKIIQEMTEMDIEWHFIPPGTPHMGGCWERLIGSVKKILRITLKEESPKDEVLLTLFAEAENIVNSRPLTHISVDPSDPQCLTPNHLLIGLPSRSPFPVSFEDEDLRKLWKKSQRLAEIFWSRWIREYLPTLSRRAKWIRDGKPVAVGDIVVIADFNSPRNSWPLGKVISIFPGRDNVVRVVEVETSSGVFKRPVTRICRVDVEIGENS